jgi:hypothetical protein
MDKAAEYRQRAEACRVLAWSHQGEQRAALMTMAAQWEAMARQSEALLDRHRQVRNDGSPGADPTSG